MKEKKKPNIIIFPSDRVERDTPAPSPSLRLVKKPDTISISTSDRTPRRDPILERGSKLAVSMVAPIFLYGLFLEKIFSEQAVQDVIPFFGAGCILSLEFLRQAVLFKNLIVNNTQENQNNRRV